MRVVAGSKKGKRLLENNYDHIRPTTDKVKQALFTKLQFFVEGKRVLDMFCGTGALGIEALSRGADEVVFIDKNPKSVGLTKQNLKNMGLQAKVLTADALKILNKNWGQFDLILIDPPYKSGLYEDALKKIGEDNLLASGGVIVCEHAKEDEFNYAPFFKIDEKKYGNIILTYLSHPPTSAWKSDKKPSVMLGF